MAFTGSVYVRKYAHLCPSTRSIFTDNHFTYFMETNRFIGASVFSVETLMLCTIPRIPHSEGEKSGL